MGSWRDAPQHITAECTAGHSTFFTIEWVILLAPFSRAAFDGLLVHVEAQKRCV